MKGFPLLTRQYIMEPFSSLGNRNAVVFSFGTLQIRKRFLLFLARQ